MAVFANRLSRLTSFYCLNGYLQTLVKPYDLPDLTGKVQIELCRSDLLSESAFDRRRSCACHDRDPGWATELL